MSYTDPEIRRLHIDDYQWDRTSHSWKLLEPRKNFNEIDENDESIEDYCQRIKDVIEVPYNVADQWLYCHYYNGNTVNNYGWISYREAVFERVTITTDQAINLKIIDSYTGYVESRKNGIPFSDFMCIPEDKKYWIQERTWRTPPVVLDVKTFPNPPPYSDVSGGYQLVEGHSRLGYLLSMYSAGEPLKETHFVYMLSGRKNI